MTHLSGMLGCPESPGYLAAKGKREEAKVIARKLWGAGGAVQLGAGAAAKGGAEAANIFGPAYRKGVVMGCLLFVFQQFSGINAIVYFSSSVFKQVGVLGPAAIARSGYDAECCFDNTAVMFGCLVLRQWECCCNGIRTVAEVVGKVG